MKRSLMVVLLALMLIAPVAVVAADEGSDDNDEPGDENEGQDGEDASEGSDEADENESEYENESDYEYEYEYEEEYEYENGSENESDNESREERRERAQERREEARERHEERREEARERHEERREEARERFEERREEARERHEAAREEWKRMRAQMHTPFLDPFQEENGTVQNQHVQFQIAPDLPGITGYQVQNESVFAQVALNGSGNASWGLQGPHFRMALEDVPELHGENASEEEQAWLRALATPHALLLVHADENASATLVLADNVSIERLPSPAKYEARYEHRVEEDGNESEYEEEIELEGQVGLYRLTLADNRSLLIAGTHLVLEGNDTLVLERGLLQLRLAHPGPGPYEHEEDDEDELEAEDEDEDDEDEASGQGRGRGRGRGQGRSGEGAFELHQQARMRVEQALTSGEVAVEVYADADQSEPVAVELGHVRVMSAQAHKAGPVKASLQIEAPDDSPGTAVVLNLDPEDLNNLTVADAAQKLGVRYDGMNISAADDLADVLDWSNDDGEAEYLLLVGGEKVQVFVSVPHFSPHSIEVFEVQSSETMVSPTAATPVPAAAALVALTVAAAMGIGRREH